MIANEKIEEKNLASNKDAAIERAKSLKIKKESAKIEAKQEAKQEEKKAEIAQSKDLIELNDAKISKYGDLLFSKIAKELKANQMQCKAESNYFFAIDSAKKQIAFKLQEESDKIDENSYSCFFKARIASFYHKKAAREKIEASFNKKIEEMRFKIQFLRDQKGFIFLI